MKTVRNVSLKKYTTFKIGGRAKVICFPENEEELLKLAARCNKKKLLILGNGSNILFSDHGFDGKIISTRRLDKIEVSGEQVSCEAGVNLFSLCHFCAEHGLSGLERLYGIPGSVGGAIVMNAGAYGCEICQLISKIKVVKNGVFSEREVQNFGYRKGPLCEGEILVSAVFNLKKGKKEQILALQSEIFEKRKQSQPYSLPSAGSIFKRGRDFFPAQLIDEWKLKGKKIGGAEISSQHAGFIVNTGNATSSDVLALICEIERKARAHGYNFEREIVIIE